MFILSAWWQSCKWTDGEDIKELCHLVQIFGPQKQHLVKFYATVSLHKLSFVYSKYIIFPLANFSSLGVSILYLLVWLNLLGHCRLPSIKQEVQQHKILYIALYLLIWGEASNLRLMPECICYIFHHVRLFYLSHSLH